MKCQAFEILYPLLRRKEPAFGHIAINRTNMISLSRAKLEIEKMLRRGAK